MTFWGIVSHLAALVLGITATIVVGVFLMDIRKILKKKADNSR